MYVSGVLAMHTDTNMNPSCEGEACVCVVVIVHIYSHCARLGLMLMGMRTPTAHISCNTIRKFGCPHLWGMVQWPTALVYGMDSWQCYRSSSHEYLYGSQRICFCLCLCEFQEPYCMYYRYKITCPACWPNHPEGDRKGTEEIMNYYRLNEVVTYGKTKIFIRTPRTVYYMEGMRTENLHIAVSGCICSCNHFA